MRFEELHPLERGPLLAVAEPQLPLAVAPRRVDPALGCRENTTEEESQTEGRAGSEDE